MTHGSLLTRPPDRAGRSRRARSPPRSARRGLQQCPSCRQVQQAHIQSCCWSSQRDCPRCGAEPHDSWCWKTGAPSTPSSQVVVFEDANQPHPAATTPCSRQSRIRRRGQSRCSAHLPRRKKLVTTIQSRCRWSQLRTPPPEAVARGLTQRDGGSTPARPSPRHAARARRPGAALAADPRRAQTTTGDIFASRPDRPGHLGTSARARPRDW